jgi:hypothetical protein
VKRLTSVAFRNGTIKSIKDIIENLNNAKLDSNTGSSLATLSSPFLSSSYAFLSQ